MVIAHWEKFLTKVVFELLILAGLGPLAGRATLAQTFVLALLVPGGLYLLGDLLLLPRLLPLIGYGWAAVGDGLFAAILLRILSPVLGAAFGWWACFMLGAAIGASEYLLHRLEGVLAEGG